MEGDFQLNIVGVGSKPQLPTPQVLTKRKRSEPEPKKAPRPKKTKKPTKPKEEDRPKPSLRPKDSNIVKKDSNNFKKDPNVKKERRKAIGLHSLPKSVEDEVRVDLLNVGTGC